jgi:hypothetical protein
MDLWLEIPQLAAGPEVTPTKPIFNTGFAARAALQNPAAIRADSKLVAMKLRFFINKTPWEWKWKGPSCWLKPLQVGKRIFNLVNNLVNIFFQSVVKSACKMAAKSWSFLRLARILN